MDYLTTLIITAGKAEFRTGDGRRWRLRQPSPEEAIDGDSAFRLMYRKVLEDRRLGNLAGSQEALEQEARNRAIAAEAVYMLPLLLEAPVASGWAPAFRATDGASLAEFEALPGEIVAEMARVYWDVIRAAGDEAKKKLARRSSTD